MPASAGRFRGTTGRPLSAAACGVRRASTSSADLPVMHCSVHQLIDRKVGRLVGVSGGEFLIEFDAEPWFVAWMKHSLRESVGMRKRLVGELDMRHVFLNAEVVNGEP